MELCIVQPCVSHYRLLPPFLLDALRYTRIPMVRPIQSLLSAALLLCLGTSLWGCGSAPASKSAKQPTQYVDSSRAVNLSGSWELDYSQSDSTQEKLDLLVRDFNRQAERRAQSNMHQGAARGMVIGGSGADSGSSIMGLVRLADLITQSSLLEIEQSEYKVRVGREEDSDLVCEFYPGELRKVETPFGAEMCGWKGHQLVFKLFLPGGLSVQHVMTRGATGQKLNIATTVTTDQVSFPFTLNRVYNRFVPGESGFRCEMTLTRGRVCTTESR
jgi:hypothetical protein